MPNSFAGKTALITGATSGIGLATASLLAAEGACIVALGRNTEKLQPLAEEFDDRWLTVRTDVTVETEVSAAVERCARHFGRLDLAFNVAGGAQFSPIVGGKSADWNATVDLCLRGAYHCIKYEAEQMVRQGGGGAIVNVSSLNQIVPLPGASGYASAKAGLGMLTQNAALELASHQIRVNALLPGLVDTPATEFVKAAPIVRDAYLERIPLGRSGSPEEIARIALFLASDDAAYITGASLVADGGWALTGYPDLGKLLAPSAGP